MSGESRGLCQNLSRKLDIVNTLSFMMNIFVTVKALASLLVNVKMSVLKKKKGLQFSDNKVTHLTLLETDHQPEISS